MNISVIKMGAKADAWQFVDGVISPDTLDRITFTNRGWKLTAVTVGNPICILGAAPEGAPLLTRISAVIGNAIVLEKAAHQAINAAKGDFGTDDTIAVQNAIIEAEKISGTVDFGGDDNKYYIAGDSFQYPGPGINSDWPHGFNRGILKISGAISLVGSHATLLLSGGRLNPGSMFWNLFWATPVMPLPNVRFADLVIDGNMSAQHWPSLPAGFTDGQVWQWGAGIILINTINLRVENCLIRNWRGDGINATGHTDKHYNFWPSRNTTIHQCEFFNIFGNGTAVNGIGININQNYYHGDGYWVAAVDIETNDADKNGNCIGIIQSVWVTNNIFDFRDGLSPVERTPDYATESAEAIAARIHLRRFVAGGGYSPGMAEGRDQGRLRDIHITDNWVWQGVADFGSFDDIEVSRNTIVNFSEKIAGRPHLIHYETLIVAAGNGNLPTGLHGAIINRNKIDSSLPGRAIYVGFQADARVEDNVIENCAAAGIRFAAASGRIANNKIINCGAIAPEDPSDAFAIAVYGGQSATLDIVLNKIVDNRNAKITGNAVYVNVAATPQVRIIDNKYNGISGKICDINGTSIQIQSSDIPK